MNLEGFFEELEENYESSYRDNIYVEAHPLYHLSMFVKYVLNAVSIDNNVLFFFKQINPKMEIEEIKSLSEKVAFTRAYQHLMRVDIDDPNHQEVIMEKMNDEFEVSLKMVLKYFEDLEEYEKCANIFSFLKFFTQEITL